MSGDSAGNGDLVPGLTRAKYEALPGVNISLLLDGTRTMAHLHYASEHPEPPTPALILGDAVHAAILEPATFEQRFIEAPDVDRRTKPGKLLWQQLTEQAGGRVILDADTYRQVREMAAAAKMADVLRDLLEAPGQPELTAVWTDGETRLPCKARIDRVCQWRLWTVLLDLKTTENAAAGAFAASVARYHYHVRAAWYRDALAEISPEGAGARRFFWVAIEKSPPYLTACYEPDEAAIEQGRKEYRRLLDSYARCLKEQKWPGYEGVNWIALPKWAQD